MNLGDSVCSMRESGLIRTSAEESFNRAGFTITGVWIAIGDGLEGGRLSRCGMGSERHGQFLLNRPIQES